ncbi:MAG: succinylglutamate desuccinylase/aspartoacylase family protein [Bryobacteraceae bacterium]|nr:succinylglutamate desuccinylase/aspartoacylase family protein [Bryobacteraceae bacterium]
MTSPWNASGWVTVSEVDAFLCQGATPGPRVAVTAGVHGDEYEGPSALIELARSIDPRELSGTLALVPVANPPALVAGTRTSPSDGLNLARTFPGDHEGSATKRLAAGLFDWLREASFAIDLHSGGLEYDFVPLAGFLGATVGENPSFAAAQRFGLPYLWSLPPTPGVLSHELGEIGTTVIGCEYGGAGRLAASGVRAYADGVRSCLRHWGVLDGQPGPPLGTAVTGDWLLATARGLFVAEKSLGVRVESGDLIARIIDVRGDDRQRFHATSDGVVLGLRSKAFISAGNWGVLIGRNI